tara:strand:+ start:316 stop:483 length:168 start_codon:yes stop_codon:yes gene_type:complete
MTIETLKLINKSGAIIERKKVDVENNIKIWTQRGWELYEDKPAKKKAPKKKKAKK